jgi:23S rRNA (guanosine2251-2'-O)-methyltransferase
VTTVPRLPLTVVLDNVRSAYNVGSVLRTADCAWIQQVVTCGVTPHANHPKVKKTALGSEVVMRTARYHDLGACIEALQGEGVQVYALEITPDATSLWDVPAGQLARPSALILGSETDGVQLNVTQHYNVPELVLPQFGVKQSMNVANTASVAVYHWRYVVTVAGLL